VLEAITGMRRCPLGATAGCWMPLAGSTSCIDGLACLEEAVSQALNASYIDCQGHYEGISPQLTCCKYIVPALRVGDACKVNGFSASDKRLQLLEWIVQKHAVSCMAATQYMVQVRRCTFQEVASQCGCSSSMKPLDCCACHAEGVQPHQLMLGFIPCELKHVGYQLQLHFRHQRSAQAICTHRQSSQQPALFYHC